VDVESVKLYKLEDRWEAGGVGMPEQADRLGAPGGRDTLTYRGWCQQGHWGLAVPPQASSCLPHALNEGDPGAPPGGLGGPFSWTKVPDYVAAHLAML